MSDQDQSYTYVRGHQVELRQEPGVYAVVFKPGRRSTSSGLSLPSQRLLNEDSEHAYFLPNGMQIYRVRQRHNRLPDKEARQRLSDDVSHLDREEQVEFASVAYRTSPESKTLMFVSRLFTVAFQEEVAVGEVDEINALHGVRRIAQLGYVENGWLLEAPSGTGPRCAVALANRYYQMDPVIFATPDLIRPIERRQQATKAGTTPSAQDRATRSAAGSQQERSVFLNQQWHLETAHVTEAWELSRGSSEVTVAVLDDGVDVEHPEFADKLSEQFDFEMQTTLGWPKLEGDTHGTPCAGVAVAAGHKASGVAPGCQLMAVRTPDYLGTVAEAEMFHWVADRGADVISCSWGPADNSGPFALADNVRSAIEYCRNQGRGGRGIPIFWAAGNGDESVSNDGYAANPDVIAVAASTSEEERAWYSDFGPEIWICAPSSGGDRAVFTTDRRGQHGRNPGDASLGDAAGDYTNDFGGTSSAAPLAAGVAALMLSVNPDLSVSTIKEILRDSAEKIGVPSEYDATGHNPLFGYGRINALGAVEGARAASTSAFAESLSASERATAPQRVVISAAGKSGAALRPPSGEDFLRLAETPRDVTPDDTTAMRISAPERHNRSGGSPFIHLVTGQRRYFAVEVASRSELFDLKLHGHERGPENFFASWHDGSLYAPRGTAAFVLPTDAWKRLRDADRLFYRLHTSSDWSPAWPEFRTSLWDVEHEQAPWITLVGGKARRSFEELSLLSRAELRRRGQERWRG